jgi:hypothetical protein
LCIDCEFDGSTATSGYGGAIASSSSLSGLRDIKNTKFSGSVASAHPNGKDYTDMSESSLMLYFGNTFSGTSSSSDSTGSSRFYLLNPGVSLDCLLEATKCKGRQIYTSETGGAKSIVCGIGVADPCVGIAWAWMNRVIAEDGSIIIVPGTHQFNHPGTSELSDDVGASGVDIKIKGLNKYNSDSPTRLSPLSDNLWLNLNIFNKLEKYTFIDLIFIYPVHYARSLFEYGRLNRGLTFRSCLFEPGDDSLIVNGYIILTTSGSSLLVEDCKIQKFILNERSILNTYSGVIDKCTFTSITALGGTPIIFSSSDVFSINVTNSNFEYLSSFGDKESDAEGGLMRLCVGWSSSDASKNKIYNNSFNNIRSIHSCVVIYLKGGEGEPSTDIEFTFSLNKFNKIYSIYSGAAISVFKDDYDVPISLTFTQCTFSLCGSSSTVGGLYCFFFFI